MSSIDQVLSDCTKCGLCTKDCQFLLENGNPLTICKNFTEPKSSDTAIAGCTLCGLCSEVCPQKIDCASAFLEIKEHIAAKGCRPKASRPLLSYQKLQSSPILKHQYFPDGCDSVFFPGCALATTKSTTTEKIYSYLQKEHKNIGIILSCCGKPSHDLGEKDLFQKHINKQIKQLRKSGIRRIITACPNCQLSLSQNLDIDVISIYDIIKGDTNPLTSLHNTTFAVHDSCTTRRMPDYQDSVRQVIDDCGGSLLEMKHCKEKALCCGDGAGASLVRPDLAGNWHNMRQEEYQESGADQLVSYCAGCAGKLQESHHLLDLLFRPEDIQEDKNLTDRSLIRYVKRYFLKKKVAGKNIFPIKPIIALIFTALVLLSRYYDIDTYFSSENITTTFSHLKSLSPLLYICILSLVPVFFLPTFPAIILGGYLYGPIWGFVYGMIGALIGASLSFLFIRYMAGESISRKLSQLVHRKTNVSVPDILQKYGWQVVIVLRLLPIFPFTPLNYILGLSSVSFRHYFIATAIGILPGCAVFILFANGFIDLFTEGLSQKSFYIFGFTLLFLFLVRGGMKKWKSINLP